MHACEVERSSVNAENHLDRPTDSPSLEMNNASRKEKPSSNVPHNGLTTSIHFIDPRVPLQPRLPEYTVITTSPGQLPPLQPSCFSLKTRV